MIRVLLICLIALPAFAQVGLRSPAFVAQLQRTAAGGGPSFPTGFDAYWKLDDTNPYEDFYTGNDLTEFFAEPNAPDSVAGKINNCLEFNGTFDFATAPDSPDLDAGSDVDFSVVGWIWVDSLAADRYIISKCKSSSGWEVLVTSGGKLVFRRWTGSSVDFTSTGSISTGQWYHFAATYDQTDYKLYLDGSLDSTHPDTTDIPTDNNVLELGRSATLEAGYYDGKIDEPGIASGKALSGTEVGDLYNSGAGLQP